MTTTPRTAMLVGALALLLLPAAAPAADVPWEDPAVFERGQVNGHATLMPFGSVEEALANDRKASASLPAPERHLEVRLGPGAGEGARAVLRGGFRRLGLGRHRGARELADAGLRAREVPEHPAPVPVGPAARAERRQPGGLLPAHLRPARGVAGPPGLPPLRGRPVGVHRLGQRPGGRLQRGGPGAGRVRRDRRTSGRGRTRSRCASCAGPTAPTSRTRTRGASPGSTATST